MTSPPDAPVCLVPAGDRCGEGAVWSADEQALYWTDINRFLIHRHDPAAGTTRSWLFDEPVVALALTTRPGLLLVALGSRLIFWDAATDTRQDQGFHLPGWPRVRLNDGRPDPAGHFWVGSMKNNVGPDGEDIGAAPGEGVLYRVAPDGTVIAAMTGIGISNTLCWSPDRRHFYFGDSMANLVWACEYSLSTAMIGARRPLLQDFPRGAPDGSAMDAEGYLWNCRYGGACLVRVAPNGVIDRVIEMPVLNITTCTFGGPDLRTLFITTASANARPTDRLAGSVFTLRTDTPGQPENRFSCALAAPQG